MMPKNGQWHVLFQCRVCGGKYFLHYGASNTIEDMKQLYPVDREEKWCPLCGEGRAELLKIAFSVSFSHLHESDS